MTSPVPIDELVWCGGFLQEVERCFDRLDASVVDPLLALREGMRWPHEFFQPHDRPELAAAWKSAIKAAVSAGCVSYPEPLDPGEPPEPRHRAAEGESPVAVHADGFAVYRSDPLFAAHETIGACLASAVEAGGEPAATLEPVLNATGPERAALLAALVRRRAWVEWQDGALAAQWLFKTRHAVQRTAGVIGQMLDPLLERDTVLSPDQWCDLLAHRIRPDDGSGGFLGWDDSVLVALVGRTIEAHGVTDRVGESLSAWKQQLVSEHHYIGGPSREDLDELTRKIEIVMGTAPAVPLNRGEAWADAAVEGLSGLPASQLQAWVALLDHAQTADGGKPKPKWSAAAAPLVEAVGIEAIVERCVSWFALSQRPRTRPLPPPRVMMDYDPNLMLNTLNARCLKGLAWCLGLAEAAASGPALRDLALSGLKAVPGRGPRDTKLSNAAVWALSRLPGTEGVAQLSALKTKVRHKPTLKGIAAALDATAEREGVGRDEVEEMSVPRFGLTEVGRRVETLGDFTAELVLSDASKAELRWRKPDGKPQKSVPKAVKDGHADALKALKADAKDIEKMLPAQRERIDQMMRREKAWPYAAWAERYLDHPLVGTLARRLIWSFALAGGETVSGVWLGGRWVDARGEPLSAALDGASVSLWHPIGQAEAEVFAWRSFFEAREIRQPFKQAHREVYLLTDAERSTEAYSNRFAAHVIRQHQFNALCGARGWANPLRLLVDADYPPASLALPAWDLRAEFWVEGIGDEFGVDTNETGTFLRLATDQVRFYPLGAAENQAHAGGGGYARSQGRGEAEPEPIPLDQIPPRVFSEVMRDVDLFVGVASVGNDPTWEDGGPEGRHRDYWHDFSFGDLSATAKTRRELLERLVPRLKIADRCALDPDGGKFLRVRGDVRTYKIHLGSGNILMEPDDQYLCIVPGRSSDQLRGAAGKVFLPFEGDRTLSIILSKAFLLAEDAKIDDPTIVSQLKR